MPLQAVQKYFLNKEKSPITSNRSIWSLWQEWRRLGGSPRGWSFAYTRAGSEHEMSCVSDNSDPEKFQLPMLKKTCVANKKHQKII